MEPNAPRWVHPHVRNTREWLMDADPPDADLSSVSGFEEFYVREYTAAVRLARLLSGSTIAAEDLAQEAFTTVYRQAGVIANPPAYLRVAIVNLCRNWCRGRGREAMRMVRIGPPTASLSAPARELDDLMTALPYRQRAVLVMRYWLDLSEAEIAEALGCRAGTVKSIHSRATARLRKELP